MGFIAPFALRPAVAVEAEGVTESATQRGLAPYDRNGSTTPVDSVPAAQKGFKRAKIPAGFEASLWASEPLLANPVAFSFDGQGRMYVAETHRYRTSVLDIRHYMFMLEDDMANRNQADWEKSIKRNFPNDWQDLTKESEVVRLVEDANGDGVADKSSVYADGFNTLLDGIASGVLARPDGVWLANIPSLIKLTGKQADGKAAKKEEIFRGFGIRFNYTGHDLHGLIKGPDGRIYFSIGDRGASVTTKEGTQLEVPDEGAIFRCEEDGSNLEVVMRGLRNPQELAFDDHGNLFTCDNDSDQGDRERLVYVVEGGDAGWRVGYQHCPQPAERNPWLAEAMWEPRQEGKNQPYSILSPLVNLPDGPGGIAHYPGTGMPAKYTGCIFVACYKGTSATSQVAVFKPVPDGASFKLEFLESFIPGCQATDVEFGPDSRLYVSFWDEGWERTAQGRILKVQHAEARKAQAAQIDEVQKLLAEGMKTRSVADLAKMLGHADQRIRLEAQWELASRGLDAVASVPENLPGLGKLHALWALGQVARKSPSDALTDKVAAMAGAATDAAWKAQCLRQLGAMQPTEAAAKALTDATTHESPRVRLFAAQGLGHMKPTVAHIRALFALGDKDGLASQEIRTAIAVALAKLCKKDPAALAAFTAASEAEKGSRLVRLLAAGKLGDQGAAIVAGMTADADKDIAMEAQRLMTDVVPAAQGLGSPDTMTRLRGMNLLFRQGDQASADALVGWISDKHIRLSPELCVEALAMLGDWQSPSPRDRVTGVFRPLPGKLPRGNALEALNKLTPDVVLSHPAVTLQLLKTAQKLKATAWCEFAAKLATDAAADPKLRIEALHTLAVLEHAGLPSILQATIANKTSAVRIAAAGMLGKENPTLAAESLAGALASGTAEDQRSAFMALKSLKTPAADAILLDQLAALTAGKVPAIAQLELLEAAASREAAEVKAAAAKAEEALKYDACLEGGDAIAGKKLYNEHAVAACKRCHQIGRSGGEAGPALDGIGAAKDRRYLLESIIDPNAQIAESFRMVVCTMKDTVIKIGVIKAETADALTIQAVGEEPETLKIADIATREAVPSGMMPGLGLLLKKRELRDLVEYLATLKEPLK